jgi:hypothetical protein
VPGAHVRQDELDQACQAEDVDLDLGARLVHRDVLDGAVGAVTGVVDQDVDAARVADDRVDGRADRVVVGDVEAEDFHSRVLQRGHPLGAPCGAVDGVSRFLQAQGCIGPDPEDAPVTSATLVVLDISFPSLFFPVSLLLRCRGRRLSAGSPIQLVS